MYYSSNHPLLIPCLAINGGVICILFNVKGICLIEVLRSRWHVKQIWPFSKGTRKVVIIKGKVYEK